MEKAAPEQAKRIEAVLAKGEELTKDELFAVLPDGKLFGAHLSQSTMVHWMYAAVATTGFLLLILLMFSVERSNPLHLLGIGLFTGTVGIVFLLVVQFCSQIDIRSIRVRGWFGLILLILALIGWSYRSALDRGQQPCAECDRIHFRRGALRGADKGDPPFVLLQAFCHDGLARRVLVGPRVGNRLRSVGRDHVLGRLVQRDQRRGNLRGPIYFLRGDPRHVGGSGRDHDRPDGRSLRSRRGLDWFRLYALRVLAVPMVLHGLYDTLLKKDMNIWALLIALASFGWLAFQIERARGDMPEGGRPSGRALAARAR